MYLYEYEDIVVKKYINEEEGYMISTFHKPQLKGKPLRFNTHTKKAYVYSNEPISVEGVVLVGHSCNPRDNIIDPADYPDIEDAPW